MTTQPAVPVEREVSGFPRPFFNDLPEVALTELHNSDRPGNSFGSYNLVEALNPLGEEGSDPNSGISIVVRK